MNRKYAKDAFNEYRKNLIENYHVSEEELDLTPFWNNCRELEIWCD